jgi:hypothetical protein
MFIVETYGHPSGQHAFDLDPLCGTITTGADANTASAFYVDLASATADYYNGCLLTFVDGSLSGQVQKITDYSTAKLVSISTAAFTAAPTTGAAFRIISQ